MTPRERRHYDALMSMQLTLTALRRLHAYFISRELAAKFDTLQAALNEDLSRLQDAADAAEKARGA